MGKKKSKQNKKGKYADVSEVLSNETSSTASTKKSSKSNGRRSYPKYKYTSGKDEMFRQSLEEDGTYTIMEMAADGNCLFRSLADQLYYDFGDNHEEVRSDVCDMIEACEEDFSVFLVLDEDEEDEDAADFESYVKAMRQDGEWGGNLELVAASRLYRRNITVFSAEMAAFTINHGEKKSLGPDLYLSYHDNDHYSSVRYSKYTKRPPPPIKTLTKKDDLDQNQDDQYDKPVPDENEEAAPKFSYAQALAKTEESVPVDSKPQTEEEEQPESQPEEQQPEEPPEKKTKKKRREKKLEPSPSEDPEEEGKFIVRKSDPCPCGSGKKYKKCCSKKEKQAARAQKLRGEDTLEDSPTHKARSDETFEMNGNFRVMKI